MSKSKGNVVTPADILAQHGSDAVRYWAASSRLGTDAALDVTNPTQMRKGRRLAIKVLNAAKFILAFDGEADRALVTAPLDLAMLAELDHVIEQATAAFEASDHARALEIVEPFFWTFCDDHLELVKERAYAGDGAGGASAVAALKLALDALLKLLAPVLPFATEETWRWTHSGSVHAQAWPSTLGLDGDRTLLAIAGTALIGIRRAKTDAKASQKSPVASLVISGPESVLKGIELVADDLKAAGRIAQAELRVDDSVDAVEVSDVVLVDDAQ
jgi:valyl-tRNA synthetase